MVCVHSKGVALVAVDLIQGCWDHAGSDPSCCESILVPVGLPEPASKFPPKRQQQPHKSQAMVVMMTVGSAMMTLVLSAPAPASVMNAGA